MVCRIGLAVVVAASVLAAECVTTGATRSAGDEAAVRAVLDTYAESQNKGDVDMHASIWDQAGVKYRTNQPAIEGMKALREDWEDRFPIYTNHMVITVKEVIVSGGWAFARGTYTNEAVPKIPGRGINYESGKFLTVFKRQPDGTWKIYADAPSSSLL
jgi:ketosteroid isomerase-like protein